MTLNRQYRIIKKNPDVSNLVKKVKLTELGNEIPDVSSFATKTAITAVENKIPSVSSLVKKKRLWHKNYWNREFNTLAVDVFNARLARANLRTKTDFDAKLSSLNRKFTANKSKNLLVENEFKKLNTFELFYW